MDIRTDFNGGKLLFRWEPIENVISISCRDAIYDVRLIRAPTQNTYQIIRKHEKNRKIENKK